MNTINLSPRQVTHHSIIERLLRKEITEKEAAQLIGKSVRQIQRIKKKVRTQGITAVIHQNTGKIPWNKTGETVTSRIIQLYETKYYGFNCLHFLDMLKEEGISIGREKLRELFVAKGFPKRKRKTQVRHERRERKPQPGLLIQQDTSTHDWFSIEKKCSLVASIDDAHNEVVFAKFFLFDGTLPNMEAIKTITETKGIAAAYYVDRASHFRTTRHESIHVQLSGTYDDTQIERSLKDVGSTLIPALSPQAKGRIERLFETLQDRLIKEIKLAQITTLEAGNVFLVTWIPKFNIRFMVPPASSQSAYRIVPNHMNLDLIFSVQEERVVRNDNTISFEGKWYLLGESKTRVSFAKAVVTVHQCIKGNLRILYKGEELSYTPTVW